MSWLLFSLLQSLAALICQFCFSLPPSSWHDWPCLLRPPGNPPRHARPRVCAQSFIWLPLKDCHAFTSLLVSLLLLRCRRQRLLWMACWYVVLWVGGGGGWCVQDCNYWCDLFNVLCTTQPLFSYSKFCRKPTAPISAFLCGSSQKITKYMWTETIDPLSMLITNYDFIIWLHLFIVLSTLQWLFMFLLLLKWTTLTTTLAFWFPFCFIKNKYHWNSPGV